jgi:hypothetical protein
VDGRDLRRRFIIETLKTVCIYIEREEVDDRDLRKRFITGTLKTVNVYREEVDDSSENIGGP